jgi:hypothetical protein
VSSASQQCSAAAAVWIVFQVLAAYIRRLTGLCQMPVILGNSSSREDCTQSERVVVREDTLKRVVCIVKQCTH